MRLLKRLCAAVLWCFIVSCYAVPPLPPRVSPTGRSSIDVHVYVESAFSERERANIVNGVLLWERATNGMVSWHMMPIQNGLSPDDVPETLPDGTKKMVVVFRRVISTDKLVDDFDKEAVGIHLLGQLVGRGSGKQMTAFLVEDRLVTVQLEIIAAAHEFGHALGLDHIVGKGIMTALLDHSILAPSREDLEAFCNVWHCKVQDLSPG